MTALLVPFNLVAQIPTLTTDSLVKTSEYYRWTYSLAERGGLSSTYWIFDDHCQLYFGQAVDHPAGNRKQKVGTWRVWKDSIMFDIPKPGKVWWHDRLVLRYRPFEISWKTADAGRTPSGQPVVLTSVVIVLSADPKLKINEVLDELKEYIVRDPQIIILPRDGLDIVSNHMRMEDLVQQYFNEQNVFVGIKQYRNKLLWIH